MIQLRRALAELYPRESDQRRVVTEAGLRESSIGFEASATTPGSISSSMPDR